MRKFQSTIATAALALGLAGCGPGETANDTAAKGDARAEAGMNSMMNNPANPFAQSEMTMQQGMMAAVGADVSDTWAKMMIEHHKGAIAMSEIVLQNNPRAAVRSMAQDVITKQGKEVDELTKLLRAGAAPDTASAQPYQQAMMKMHEAMTAAKGSDVSDTYLHKMLEHHRGAVAMSEVVLGQTKDAKIRAAAEKIRVDQSKEIAMVEAMLRDAAKTSG